MLSGAAVVALISKLDAANAVVVIPAVIIAVNSNSFFISFPPFKTTQTINLKKIQTYLMELESYCTPLYTIHCQNMNKI